MSMTRRRFLEGTLVVVSIAGGVVFWNRSQHNRKRIRDHLSYLRLERGAVRQFLREYEEANGSGSADGKDTSQLARQFLLSSDFFHFDADESQTIQYSRLADPYVNPCYNPLARFR